MNADDLLPNPEWWPEGYIYLHHNDEWLLLLSTQDGDLTQVQKGGFVQARIAINRATGEIVRPTPGVPIARWQAETLGELEQYWANIEQLETEAVSLEDWDFMDSRIGEPKQV